LQDPARFKVFGMNIKTLWKQMYRFYRKEGKHWEKTIAELNKASATGKTKMMIAKGLLRQR
jgi:hypothetical protein